jgi:hypothetical protein
VTQQEDFQTEMNAEILQFIRDFSGDQITDGEYAAHFVSSRTRRELEEWLDAMSEEHKAKLLEEMELHRLETNAKAYIRRKGTENAKNLATPGELVLVGPDEIAKHVDGVYTLVQDGHEIEYVLRRAPLALVWEAELHRAHEAKVANEARETFLEKAQKMFRRQLTPTLTVADGFTSVVVAAQKKIQGPS